ncbi:hypothetical protein SAMN05660642_02696 [Geodermatophilus siccatus]|uniref:Uncharacterized protein n=1 Tax=Geodermatophilus siccatus TaxID=1137991 RepID=A0A1G9TZ63_9ACTN|nr:hypothetical protein [Geodermatophilus siccatus]SDM52555.1 hypothetical protein SAMN05660642_02696 [Geodermatophilus siccatus]
MTVRGAVGSSPSRLSGETGGGAVPPRPSFESRRELLDLLRRYALCVETANVLEARAGRCASPHLAAVLRERADARRRMAEGVLADLLRQGVPAVRRRPPDTGRERRGR